MSADELDTAALRARHRAGPTWATSGGSSGGEQCTYCSGMDWPCETVQLLDEIERLRAALAFHVGNLATGGGASARADGLWHHYVPEPISTGADAPCKYCREGSRHANHFAQYRSAVAAGPVQPAPTAEYGRGFNAAATLAHEVMTRNEALAMKLDSKTSSYTEGYADGLLRVVEDLMETLPPGAFPQPSAGSGSTDQPPAEGAHRHEPWQIRGDVDSAYCSACGAAVEPGSELVAWIRSRSAGGSTDQPPAEPGYTLDDVREVMDDPATGLTDAERAALKVHLMFEPKAPEPHPFQPTAGADSWGGNCGRCGGPGGAPWHISAHQATHEFRAPTHGRTDADFDSCGAIVNGKRCWAVAAAPVHISTGGSTDGAGTRRQVLADLANDAQDMDTYDGLHHVCPYGVECPDHQE